MFLNIELIQIPIFVFENAKRNTFFIEEMTVLINCRRGYLQLIESHTASIDTLRKRIKETFAHTNLIENFTPYSCRSASATKAFNMSLDIMDILRKAYWSNAKTFLQHYKKEIISYEGVDFNKIIEY